MRQNDYDRLDFGSKFKINDFTIGAFAIIKSTSVQNDSHKLTSVNFITNFDYRQFSLATLMI